MDRKLRATVLVTLMGVALGYGVVRADPPPPARIEASVSPGLVPFGPTSVTIEPDGATTITQDSSRGGKREPALVLQFRLTPEELEEERSIVASSRFFDSWGRSRGATCQSTWRATIRVGERELAREGIYDQPEFESLLAYLHRFVMHAHVVGELRRGEFSGARSSLDRLVHPVSLVPELAECAVRTESADRCAIVAALLLDLPTSADPIRGVKDLLARLEADRRGAALSAWADAVKDERRAEMRAAFLPIALAEAEASWARWNSMSPRERGGFMGILSLLFRSGEPKAFSISEQMARTLSKPGAPVVPYPLLSTGAPAIAVVVRLLDDADPGARECGAKMAESQAGALRLHQSLGEGSLLGDEKAALEKRFLEEIVPALERRLADTAESFAIRKYCVTALDWWDGRIKAADARAREAADAQRRRADAERAKASQPKRPAGTLALAGRLLGAGDVPLPGFSIRALDRDGQVQGSAVTSEDGTFRIQGLAPGSYDLFQTGLAESWSPDRSSGSKGAEGVPAGGEAVQIRIPGQMIRGRLVDDAGKPVPHEFLSALMRDAPSYQGPTYGSATATTDEKGRFWLVRLIPGVYDVTLRGHPAIGGATGIETGPDERTLELLVGATIAGRFVDETGEPMPELSYVTLATMGASWDTVQSTQTTRDGRFRFIHVDPSRHCRVYGSIVGTPQPTGSIDDVAPGAEDLVLKIDTSPHLRFLIDFGDRGGESSAVRIERVGEKTTREFRGGRIHWRAALPGTWTVFAQLRDVDAQGSNRLTWTEIGTVTTGEPEKTFAVPR